MYKGHRIIIFLVVFLAIVLTPLFVNLGHVDAVPTPSLDTPQIDNMASKQCVESTEFMRAEHMQMLDTWRTEAVRDGAVSYTSSTGQVYEVSLQNGCLECHSNRSEFCDSCHNYVGVDPNCWDCHTDLKDVTGP